MTNHEENPELENQNDDAEVIEDPEELAQYIAEQELIRSTTEDLGIDDAEEALKKTAELTAEQMLSVDDELLTQEQRAMKTEWRDSIIVMVIAEGVKKRWNDMLTGQGNGTVKNTKYNQGYMDSLNDLYKNLMNIVPEEYLKATSGVDVYADEEATIEEATDSDAETPEGESGETE